MTWTATGRESIARDAVGDHAALAVAAVGARGAGWLRTKASSLLRVASSLGGDDTDFADILPASFPSSSFAAGPLAASRASRATFLLASWIPFRASYRALPSACSGSDSGSTVVVSFVFSFTQVWMPSTVPTV